MPPILDELPNDSDGNYRVSWQEQNPSADPDYFQLDELNGLTIGTDDAESGSGLWTLDGFALSTSRYHSGSSQLQISSQRLGCFFDDNRLSNPDYHGNEAFLLVLVQHENNYDDAFVEVSKDGRSYDVLDIFTGSQAAGYTKSTI